LPKVVNVVCTTNVGIVSCLIDGVRTSIGGVFTAITGESHVESAPRITATFVINTEGIFSEGSPIKNLALIAAIRTVVISTFDFDRIVTCYHC